MKMKLLTKFKNLHKYEKLALVVIILAIIIRFSLASMYHVSGDACWHISNAKFIATNNELPLFEQFGRDEPFWPPPLFHLVVSFVYGVFLNFSENAANFSVKMVSPLLGSLTLIFFYFISRELFNKKIAFFSLLFLAFIPLHIDYSVFSYIDGTVTFLAVLSVYLALKNKIALSAVTAGLTILTKYNGIFILPAILFIVYLKNKKKKDLIKNFLIVLIIAGAIGSIWFIRNWIYLGNPVWPFLNNLFHGFEVISFAESATGSINILNIFSITAITSLYLGIFGVPDGNISTLTFFKIPYLELFLAVWLIGTIIFIIPFILGLTKKFTHKKLLILWIGSYILLVLIYVINASWSVSRFMLPAFPAVALIWGIGIEKIKHKQIKKALLFLITIIAICFVLTSFVKVGIAAKSWNIYHDDFEWVKENTDKKGIFLTSSQCIPYNIERQTLRSDIKNLNKADYIFVNQHFRLDNRALHEKDIIEELKKEHITQIYENKKTETKVYKIN